ncbi:MAG: phosphoribosylamine--glycine ligase [Candidatus Marinimicrobia bacterium]|nr:phosphoribosylamine--glycine ligase [Candidatus Neomarinimicrobiota bacterium]|tara:strand:- start:21774 stop:23054 length:1281 start_codon:yes stop_codon:yes gene_type:complete
MYNVLVLGSGGREHSMVWSLIKDKNISKVFCAPGNAGTESIAKNVSVDLNDNNQILNIIKKYNIDYTVVGPENPLNNGIVDFLSINDCDVFGPTQHASQLECSKLFARKFMEKYNIPQPSFFECSSEEEVISVSTKLGFPIVLKADGLAAGKGVLICSNQSDLNDGLDVMFTNKKFGDASNKISVEECLKGEELSIFVVTDGEDYKILNSAQDHKRVFDGDKGPNTGGMGAYCPAPLFDEFLEKKVVDRIILPTIRGMKKEGHPYKGFLYIGIMIVAGDPYVIEYNARLGDPESQVLMPMLKDGLFPIVKSVLSRDVSNLVINNKEGYSVAVVLSSEGYPDEYKKNMLISGLDDSFLAFHSGTSRIDDKIYANGGRVLNVIGHDVSLDGAIFDAYQNVKKIMFDNMYYRTDIGEKGLLYLRGLSSE